MTKPDTLDQKSYESMEKDNIVKAQYVADT